MTDHNKRYDRQIKLPEVGFSGQQRLNEARVLIVGVGGLGCPVAQYLTAAGVGHIGLMDHDKVDISNLHRQILFSEADVGQPKAEVAKLVLLKQNSQISFTSYTEGLTPENAVSLFQDYDLIIDGTDNFQTKYLINDACVLVGKPWVYASIFKYEGQLSVFNYQDGPSYRCLFPKAPTKDLNCEETGVIGVLPGVLGTLQATEALKIILQIGDVLTGRLKIIDTLSMREQVIRFKRNEGQITKVKDRSLQLEQVSCELNDLKKLYLDVREPHEQPQANHERILKIPLPQLAERHQEIPLIEPVYVYCQSGVRSKRAIQLLEKVYGFSNLINVNGGIKTILK